MAKILTGSDQVLGTNLKIWFEVCPMRPREREGKTHVDLAVGNIVRRQGTHSGITLENVESPWVCFCEMKWYSDISPNVSYDIHRNQLVRLIENALCFEGNGKYAAKVYVTLVTPLVFREASSRSRLYQYKFEEYSKDRSYVVRDLNVCALKKRSHRDRPFPDLSERLACLSLHWATYDELFENLPPSAIAAELRKFWREHGNYQGRK
ncbi:MAG: hypothetical protein HXY36_03750 [Chloroflexi bacterium]|nr:hypothetical protein [Chloroflexota bacterium]